MQLDSVEKFYKYSDVEGARYILRDGTLKFSFADEYNDPFDTKVDMLSEYDFINTLPELQKERLNILLSDEPLPQFSTDIYAKKTAELRQILSNKTQEEKENFKNLVLADPPESFMDIDRIRAIFIKQLEEVKNSFSYDTIFCASLIYDNLLLWSHYAEKHKGVALEFVANIEKDSLLRAMTKVNYSAERPFLYKSPKDFVYKSMFQEIKDVLNEYIRTISLTKSLDWKYEQEVRVYIANIFDPKPYLLHNYHADELRAIYLGCKADPNVEKELVGLAYAKNPAVKVFKMTTAKASYDLKPIEMNINQFI